MHITSCKNFNANSQSPIAVKAVNFIHTCVHACMHVSNTFYCVVCIQILYVITVLCTLYVYTEYTKFTLSFLYPGMGVRYNGVSILLFTKYLDEKRWCTVYLREICFDRESPRQVMAANGLLVYVFIQ